MPKPYTFPILFDDVLQLSTTKLKEWGYFEPHQIKDGVITWSSNGNYIGSISIRSNTLNNNPYIILDYKYQEEERKYLVYLETIPSNLGKGVIWYFICPKTNKRCRKLYSIDGYFFHREAFLGCMYESQTKSKAYRMLETLFGAYFGIDQVYDEIYEKNFKKTYKGKLTKRYLKLKGLIDKYNNTNIKEMDKYF